MSCGVDRSLEEGGLMSPLFCSSWRWDSDVDCCKMSLKPLERSEFISSFHFITQCLLRAEAVGWFAAGGEGVVSST